MSIDTIVLHNPKETIEAWEFPAMIGKKEYQVTVPKLYRQKLTGGTLSARELVFRSLLFLLEREPKNAILSEFSLEDISRYFPEYERHIMSNL